MRALLLSAGFGTRLRPVTDRVPKCLVRIQGRPLLDYWFDLLLPDAMERVLVNTNYLSEQVRDHVAASPWSGRVDLVHETALLGTGGTVLANRQWFGHGPLMVAHADNLTDFDAAAFMRGHANRPFGCAITMLAFRTDAPQLCGILEQDASGVVRGFHEKIASPPGNLANGAIYIFEPEVVAYMDGLKRTVVDLSTEVIPHFIGRIFAVEHRGYHRDIGNVASLEQANRDYALRNVAGPPPACASMAATDMRPARAVRDRVGNVA
jgi:mannose-1-phosphate guanylyltransferase